MIDWLWLDDETTDWTIFGPGLPTLVAGLMFGLPIVLLFVLLRCGDN